MNKEIMFMFTVRGSMFNQFMIVEITSTNSALDAPKEIFHKRTM